MKTCGGCGENIRDSYCVCPRCGWLEPEAAKRDEKIIRKWKSQKTKMNVRGKK